METKDTFATESVNTDSEVVETEETTVTEDNTKKKSNKITHVKPKLNFVLTTYYKGTALEGVNKKLEEYIDNADINESDINSI